MTERTDPMIASACRDEACPCKALNRAADAWGAAAKVVAALPDTRTVIDFVPQPIVPQPTRRRQP